MSRIFVFLILTIVFSCKPLSTTPGADGTYVRYFPNGKKSGELLLYKDSDSTALVYMSLQRGAPSYNSGGLFERILWDSEGGWLEIRDDYMDCRLQFRLKGNTIDVSVANHECGFGYGVSAEGTFVRVSSERPEYFENREGSRIYFSEYGSGMND
ncbi:hypothetical protein PP178_00895 [Zeaxanthinibacter sp. PT1]|uniref:hypothetical protein n=1 Tax=Zeaxanthinibacter TaxID=561554 RepID=UPI00234AFAB5|nr:hypothetical protein [Zeaxanthinibacter sp. PT1]MDC6350093.1 hypothetical protein [Zeaxanthinibacter sp. PT1]